MIVRVNVYSPGNAAWAQTFHSFLLLPRVKLCSSPRDNLEFFGQIIYSIVNETSGVCFKQLDASYDISQ